MMLRLSKLQRTPAGSFKARKGIPAAVREDYQRRYGQRWEVIWSMPPGTPPSVAKAAHAEWLSLVEHRIGALMHAAGNGDAIISLDQRQTDAIAADWYRQYVSAREGQPGDAVGWEVAIMDAEAALEGDADLPWGRPGRYRALPG